MASDPGPNAGRAEVASAITPAMVHTTQIHGTDVTVEFIQHACDRMTERGVVVRDVLACLRAPDQRGLPADPGRQRVRRRDATSPTRALDVVYEELAPDRIRVITVVRLRA